jgi:hypothetical protein
MGFGNFLQIKTAHNNDTVTIVATDVAGNEAEQLITVSVKETNLSTSIVWSSIGDDNKINANEMAATTLSGTVAITGTVNSINISSIVFKQGDAIVHTIGANLLSVNANDNTWTLDNSNTWTSKLTQGDYTISSTLILLSLPIPLQTIEVDKLVSFTDTVISCSALLPAT